MGSLDCSKAVSSAVTGDEQVWRLNTGVMSRGCICQGRNSEAKMEGIEVESNSQQRVKCQLAVIAASAIVVMGVVIAAVLGQEQTAPAAAGQMTIGQTTTTTTAPAAMVTSFASPTMKATRPNGFG